LATIVLLLAVIIVGFVLLVSNSLRNRNPIEVLLFSILIVVTGLSIKTIAPYSAFAYIGLFLSVIGFLIGTVSFLQQGKKMSENK